MAFLLSFFVRTERSLFVYFQVEQDSARTYIMAGLQWDGMYQNGVLIVLKKC